MNSKNLLSANVLRTQFTQAMSEMYQLEVPQYKRLLSIVTVVNSDVIAAKNNISTVENLALEHHGAIRLGTKKELFLIRRLFAVLGMYPVDYYDLSVAGIPVHSTAFRPLDKNDLSRSPFRLFCSLLRLDLIKDNVLRLKAEKLLSNRNIFTDKLLNGIKTSEEQKGLTQEQANSFIESVLDVFRWHKNSTVDKQTYEDLKVAHGLIADIVSFKGPHINHLTPKVLDIDKCQDQFLTNDIKAKAFIEGPPKRKCPILLRQTSFIAIEEAVVFSDSETGSHTARFGEVEQRGIALTPKGRALYDQLLAKAKSADTKINYNVRLEEAFNDFPDDYEQLHAQGLAYFYYSINESIKNQNIENMSIDKLLEQGFIQLTPIIYEDFLPVSAAGIFTSNLAIDSNHNFAEKAVADNKNLEDFEEALGEKVQDSFELYEKLQQESLDEVLLSLRVKHL